MQTRAYLLLVIFFFSVLVYFFIDYVEQLKLYGPSARSAHSIVVLTGGSGRADLGLELLRRGRAGMLILSGVNLAAEIDSIYPAGVTEIERMSIFLEKRSKSTFQNAMRVRTLTKSREIDSILLVTSSYHMKRALFIFNRILPGTVVVTPESVSGPEFRSTWWKGRGVLTAVSEFSKYYWYYYRFHIEEIVG